MAMVWESFSPIQALQRTKQMIRMIFDTFSHTPKRLPNSIPLLVPISERSYLLQLELKNFENIPEA